MLYSLVGAGIYTSADGGSSWLRAAAPDNKWTKIVCDASGQKLAAAAYEPLYILQIYTGKLFFVAIPACLSDFSATECCPAYHSRSINCTVYAFLLGLYRDSYGSQDLSNSPTPYLQYLWKLNSLYLCPLSHTNFFSALSHTYTLSVSLSHTLTKFGDGEISK